MGSMSCFRLQGSVGKILVEYEREPDHYVSCFDSPPTLLQGHCCDRGSEIEERAKDKMRRTYPGGKARFRRSFDLRIGYIERSVKRSENDSMYRLRFLLFHWIESDSFSCPGLSSSLG